MEKNIPKAPLPKVSLDELFSTQKERDEADLEKVVEIEISSIDDFPNHPFKVINNDDMKQMVESIKENGVLLPVIVRKKDNDRYEMISGHRRKFASKLAKLEKIPCIIMYNKSSDSGILAFNIVGVAPQETSMYLNHHQVHHGTYLNIYQLYSRQHC